MKNFVKILLVTVFFSLLPVANLFALSKEATEVIEAMRARLKQRESQELKVNSTSNIKSVSSDDEYIPGKELSAALARYRRNYYSKAKYNLSDIIVAEDSTSTSETVQSVPATTIEETPSLKEDEDKNEVEVKESNLTPQTPEVYEPEKTDNQADNNDSTDKEDELIIIEAREADDSEAMNIPIDFNETATQTAPVTTKKSDEYVPGQLLQQSVQRIRHSRNSNKPASAELDEAIDEYERKLANKNSKNSQEVISRASEEIEELFNNPDKRSIIAEEGRDRYNQSLNNSDDSSETSEIDDEKFNDYISKYNFKMPENYRIILE